MALSDYQAIVQAASEITELVYPERIEDVNIQEAVSLLDEVRPRLDTVRKLLSSECRVPLTYDASFFDGHMDGLQHLRNLCRGFATESSIAAYHGDFTLVATNGMTTLELANAVRRGGLIVDVLVGIAICGVAIDSLRRVRTQFDEPTRCRLISGLQRLEIEREPFQAVVDRDQSWELAVGYDDHGEPAELDLQDPEECGLSVEEQEVILQMLHAMASKPEPERRQMYADQDRCAVAKMRMLMVDLALRGWRESHGSFPAAISELSSELPEWVTADPFTDRSFVYRMTKCDSYQLYSLGPSKLDHGGVFGHWLDVAAGRADLCLDADDFEPDDFEPDDCSGPPRPWIWHTLASKLCWWQR